MIFYIIALAAALGVAYGLVYWAYRAETDRSARVGLYLVYGFPGILLFVAGLALTVYSKEAGPFLLGAGLGITLPLVKPFRVLLARFTPIDPASPTDMSGLCLFLGVVGALIASLWFPLGGDAKDHIETLCPPVCGDSGSTERTHAAAVGYEQLLIQMLAWIGLAYVVVGTGLRRRFKQANERLGVSWPSPKVIGISFGFLFVALFVNGLAGALTALFQPETNEVIQEGLKDLTGDLQNPIGAILIGVSAGVGEELFFRGALQPRFGIVLTSLCFALLHTQYGFSFVTLGVFGMGMVFGYQRMRWGAISPMLTHGLVNLIAVLIQAYA